jgi:hypothetical protein
MFPFRKAISHPCAKSQSQNRQKLLGGSEYTLEHNDKQKYFYHSQHLEFE